MTGSGAPLAIANAIAGPQTSITGASFVAVPATGTPNGTSNAALAGFPSNGSSSFGILTTGNVSNVAVQTTVGNTTLSGTPVSGRGNAAYDATVLKVDLTVPAAANCLTFDFKFLSEEYPAYVGSSYNDAFIAELDNSTWTTLGNVITAPKDFAFDSSGKVVSINAAGIGGLSAANGIGTEFNGATVYPSTSTKAGGATALLHASTQVTPGAHSVYFSIFDNGDNAMDSAVFLHGLAAGFVPNPATNCVPGAAPVNYQLGLAPATGSGSVGVAQTATATLTTATGAPVPNAAVKFTVAGVNPTTGTATTDASGNATFNYIGTSVGTDQLSACYQPSGANSCVALASASRAWTAPVKIAADNQTITYGDPDPHFTYQATGLLGSDQLTGAPTCAVTGAHTAAGTYPIICSGAAAKTGYVFSYLAGTLTVAPAAATIVADNASQTYGDPTPHLTYTVGGLRTGDVLVQTPTCSVHDPHVAAGHYPIVCSGADGGPNYTLSYTRGTLTVGSAVVTVTPDSASIVYGGADPSFSYTATGLVGADQLTATPTCGITGAHTEAGTYPITCSGADAGSNYTVSYAPATLTVTKRVGLVTADPQRVTYGDGDPSFTSTVSGLRDGDSLITPATCAVDGEHTAAGHYVITCSGADAGPNYTLEYASGTLAVDRAALVVTADNQSRDYGVADPSFTATTTGLIGSDALTTPATCGVDGAHAAADSYPITCSGADAGNNYAISYAPGTLHVTPTPVVITANSTTRPYGTPDPAFTYQVTGLQGTDDLIATPTCTADADHNVGTYPIICADAGAGDNYAISYSPGTLSVTPATATVTANDQATTYGSADPGFTYTVAGLVNDDRLTAQAACGVDGDHSSARTYSITCAGGDAGPNYTLAYAPGTLVVLPAVLTIAADNTSSTYGGDEPSFTSSASGLIGADAFQTPATCAVATPHRDAGSYPITCSGANAGSNYAIRYVAGTLTVEPAPVIVQAGSATTTFGAPAPSVGYTVDGLLGADTLNTAPICDVAVPHTAAGTYPVTCSGADAGPNYRVSYAPGTLTITRAQATVTADSASIVYGDADPTFDYSVSGLVGSDALITTPTCTVSAAHTAAGSYPIACAGAEAGPNYIVGYSPGTLSVAQRAGVVTAASQTITYGDRDPSFNYTVSGLEPGDSLTTAPTCGVAGPHSAAGTYPIECSGGDGGNNYTLSYRAGTLTVVPAALRITANDQSITYGNPDPTFGYSVSGLIGSDTLVTPPTCAVTGAHTAAGSYAITCAAADPGGDYTVTYASATLTVHKATVNVAAPSPTVTYGVTAATVTLTPSLAGLLGSDTAASTGLDAISCTTAAKPTTGGSYPAGAFPITCTGPASTADYTVSYTAGTLTVAKAVLIVAAANASRPYGTPNPQFTTSVTGLVNSDTASTAYTGSAATSTAATPASHPGAYPITVTAGNLAAANYSFAYRPGTLTITQAPAVLAAGAMVTINGAGGATVAMFQVNALLTYGTSGTPAAGQTIAFSVAGQPLCTATTTQTGAAMCPITVQQQVQVVHNKGYTATFTGSPDLQPTTGNGDFVKH